MIQVSQLSRRYGDFAAVDQVSFDIAPGEVVGLLGHNGAGKTTIMKMLTGFLEPSAGRILVNGMDVQAEPLPVQAQMGYLPESLPLYPELTVADYLTHAAELRNLDPAQSVPAAIAATQLDAKAFDTIDTLSRGYKQRLGVAQAILHKPSYLILDEPSNGLDPNQIREMRALIRSLATNATVILSTHIMQEVNALCDRALILRNGKLVVDERLDELRKTSQIRLRTAAGAEVADVLSGSPGIGVVQQSQAGEWQVRFEGDADTAVAAVAQRLVQANLPVYHLAPQTRDLESVFAEVNEARDGEQAHAA